MKRETRHARAQEKTSKGENENKNVSFERRIDRRRGTDGGNISRNVFRRPVKVISDTFGELCVTVDGDGRGAVTRRA